MSERRRIKASPVIDVRIQPNVQCTQVIWEVRSHDGTKAHGFAKTAGDAMRDAAAFADAMMQPRRGGLFTKSDLRVVGEPRDD